MDVHRVERREFNLTLPNELWIRILRLATFVCGSLDVDHDDPFDHDANLWNTAIEERVDTIFPEIRRSNARKLRFMLVCRLWHDIVQPFLYETLHIARDKDCATLAHTLKSSIIASESSDVPHKQSLGVWTRRLDLSMPRFAAQDVAKFAPILACLPNLEILTINQNQPRTRLCAELWELLTLTCGKSLLRLNSNNPEFFRWHAESDRGSAQVGFSQTANRLRTVNQGLCFTTERGCVFCSHSLRRLVSCLLNPGFPAPCSCPKDPSSPPYPALTTACMKGVTQRARDTMLDILAVQGATLTTLVLPDFKPWRDHVLLDGCPNLTRIIITICWTEDDNKRAEHARHFAHNIPITLTHLGIILNDDITTDIGRPMWLTPEDLICWLASSELEKRPEPLGLKLIRFFDPERFFHTPDLVKADSRFGVALQYLEKHGIRVEGFDGQEIKCVDQLSGFW
ncbi:uncharacterized protein STEHIDRAFT_157429 [Stereum hirsutum FP-91666 SS1]|uniref:uncharacterized protein n=1 Tax=Stereum hirsutum (strain FP-91666) TaxID=721885 RepID=UPI000444A921|nr:uncharacterized protein STEHIDRAFT_157429 [Stereum hirsutum FP-91666 SS1]EIM85898.1 hypothetical protein STEHIDRAFT_157429 [Stereum hirsutum FP-91666 SS1]